MIYKVFVSILKSQEEFPCVDSNHMSHSYIAASSSVIPHIPFYLFNFSFWINAGSDKNVMTFANDKHFGIVDVGQCKTGEEYESRQRVESHEYLLFHNLLGSLSLPQCTFYTYV